MIRISMWDRTIELGWPDRWIITSRPPWEIQHWLDSRFVRVPEERIMLAIHAALAEVGEHDVLPLWQQLYDRPLPPPDSLARFAYELVEAAGGPIPRIIVLERLIERGQRFAPLVWKPRPLPPRTTTDHYVVVEAVDTEQRPVAGLALELLIADGEVKSAHTDCEGIARVERIQAGRVVIRVLGVEGQAWRPLSGPPAQSSGSDERLRTHVVKRGECLSRIALQYGIHGWKRLWEHAGNRELRKKRKSPHVLLPGDQVTIPGIDVHEIIRPTDAAHRLEVMVPLQHLAVALHDFNGLRFAEEPYELVVPGESTARAGTTDAEGVVRAAVPATVTQVEVRCPELGVSWHFELSSLEAIDGGELVQDPGEALLRPEQSSVGGLQARLNALGYAAGAVTGRWSEQTALALARFQARELHAQGAELGRWTSETDAALGGRYGA